MKKEMLYKIGEENKRDIVARPFNEKEEERVDLDKRQGRRLKSLNLLRTK